MGMRGVNATPKRWNPSNPSPLASPERHTWDPPGLSRAERVIRFVNSLPCTAGPLAGATLKLRPCRCASSRRSTRPTKPAIGHPHGGLIRASQVREDGVGRRIVYLRDVGA